MRQLLYRFAQKVVTIGEKRLFVSEIAADKRSVLVFDIDRVRNGVEQRSLVNQLVGKRTLRRLLLAVVDHDREQTTRCAIP